MGERMGLYRDPPLSQRPPPPPGAESLSVETLETLVYINFQRESPYVSTLLGTRPGARPRGERSKWPEVYARVTRAPAW